MQFPWITDISYSCKVIPEHFFVLKKPLAQEVNSLIYIQHANYTWDGLFQSIQYVLIKNACESEVSNTGLSLVLKSHESNRG